MPVLKDDDLLAKAELRAGYRLHVVATKLSQVESQRFAALAKKRGRRRGDLLRQFILDELSQENANPTSSLELVEIIGIRLLLTNALRPIATGQKVTPEIFDGVLAEVKRRKRAVALEAQQEAQGAA